MCRLPSLALPSGVTCNAAAPEGGQVRCVGARKRLLSPYHGSSAALQANLPISSARFASKDKRAAAEVQWRAGKATCQSKSCEAPAPLSARHMSPVHMHGQNLLHRATSPPGRRL
jgi:hypothetical protein